MVSQELHGLPIQHDRKRPGLRVFQDRRRVLEVYVFPLQIPGRSAPDAGIGDEQHEVPLLAVRPRLAGGDVSGHLGVRRSPLDSGILAELLPLQDDGEGESGGVALGEAVVNDPAKQGNDASRGFLRVVFRQREAQAVDVRLDDVFRFLASEGGLQVLPVSLIGPDGPPLPLVLWILLPGGPELIDGPPARLGLDRVPLCRPLHPVWKIDPLDALFTESPCIRRRHLVRLSGSPYWFLDHLPGGVPVPDVVDAFRISRDRIGPEDEEDALEVLQRVPGERLGRHHRFLLLCGE